jgi:hypothetical protein
LDFIFEGCILLRLLLQSFWVPSIATVLLEWFFIITITYPLHVSALTVHLQVKYTYWLLPKELFFYNGSVALVLVINCIHSLLFW